MKAITSADVFVIAGPAMAANLTTPLLGIVSTAAIGRLGESSLLGGVAIASAALDSLFWLFGFLRMGTVAFTAQALGAHDTVEIRAVFLRALFLAAIAGLGLAVFHTLLATAIFNVMGGSDAVIAAATQYFSLRLLSAPFVLGNYVVLGWLVGQARTGTALALQVGINLINIAMTLLLVVVLEEGVAGAAMSTIAAECVGFICGIATAWRLSGGQLAVPRAIIFDRDKLLHMFAVNRDIMIRTALLISAFLFFTAQGARSGDQILAANAVLGNFLMIGSFFLDGLANAAEQLCGRSYGARDAANFRRTAFLVLSWSAACGAITSFVFAAFGGFLIDIVTTSTVVRAISREFMVLAALAPACGVLAYCFDGIFIGATWTRAMRNLMLLAFAIYLIAWYLLQPLGNSGLWMAILIFLAARGLLQALRYPAMVRSSFGEFAN